MLELAPDAEVMDRPAETGGRVDRDTDIADRLCGLSPAQFVEAGAYGPPGETRDVGGISERALSFPDLVDPLVTAYPDENVDDLVLALLAAYLYRTSGDAEQCIPVTAAGCLSEPGAPLDEETAFRPVVVLVEASAPFQSVIDSVRRQRRALLTEPAVPFSALDSLGPLGDRTGWKRPLPLVVNTAETWNAPGSRAALVEVTVDAALGEARLVFPQTWSPLFGEAVAEHLCGLANAVAHRPEIPVGSQDYLTAAERQRIVVEWNTTDVDFGNTGGLIEHLEMMAEQAPDHPAVIYQDNQISYAAFNARVNRLARYLRKSNVGADTFVAICLERSVEMVVAIWAILKAGGAYVPLNVEDPPQRLAAIIRNAGARVILTEEKFVEKLPKTSTTIVTLAPELEAIGEESEENPERCVKPNDLAYMIYTSGSTGEPKGVLIEHEAIWNRIAWMQDAYGLTPDDRVLQKTPYTFDVSVWEFLWPLVVGSTLVVAEPGGHVVPSYLARLIQQERITCVHFVPSVLRLFLTCPILKDIPLRMVFCSGEALSYELQEQFLARFDADLHNLYGPTEAAVDVTYWHCHPRRHRGRVPIGKPIANTRMHILDDFLQPVPVGVPGELYIGGIGLARGYWQKPELTSQRFIDDPLGLEEGGKLYMTGDVARYLPDGNIEYLGRNDHQVKVNGIRIELGEIESVIRMHPAIQDAAVITQKTDGGNPQLLAFMVPREQGKGNAALDHLREFLERRLPPHMIPRRLNHISRIPLTVSGKVDRKSLAAQAATA